MKINKLQDVDLSKYKLAYFQGDSLIDYDLCQDDVMKLADAGDHRDINLVIGLIPKDRRLQDCNGDDWDDVSARDNASGFYTYPKGTIFLKGYLGQELTLCEEI